MLTIIVQEKAALIWNTVDILRGLYKPHESSKVISPMIVIKRLHDILLPVRDAVLRIAKKIEKIKVVWFDKANSGLEEVKQLIVER